MAEQGGQEVSVVVDGLLDLYRNYWPSEYIGEPVTNVQHALQAADNARQAGYKEDKDVRTTSPPTLLHIQWRI